MSVEHILRIHRVLIYARRVVEKKKCFRIQFATSLESL
jgi:hypothetical protein